jgi:pyruvate kinase
MDSSRHAAKASARSQHEIEPLTDLDHVRRSLLSLREAMLALERRHAAALDAVVPQHRISARNLIHYLAMRRKDLRGLQVELAQLGLSSIGRAEAYALSSVNNVLGLTDRLLGERQRSDADVPCDHALGAKLLGRNARRVLGAARRHRAARIMVTMPSDAAHDYGLVHDLLKDGMDCMRINCAHDDPSMWSAMLRHLRKARAACNRDCTILMDLAGPKIRTGAIEPGPAVRKIRPSRDAYGRVTRPARLLLSAKRSAPAPGAAADEVLCVDDKLLAGLRRGDSLRFLDTRGRRRHLNVAAVTPDGVLTEMDRTAYITNGTTLSRAGRGKHPRVKADVRGIEPVAGTIFLSSGDSLIIASGPAAGTPARVDSSGRVLQVARVPCTLPAALASVKAGERVSFDDGLITGRVQAIDGGEIWVRIEQTPPRGAHLKADKGINFPDTRLDLPAVTEEDAEHLAFIAKNADLVGLSFVNHERDVTSLIGRLKALTAKPPGIVLKIETQRGFERLPAILLSAMRHSRFAVMIARGDLAVECGYERLAEIQEEILWICEAAHCPAIWATQVLASLVKDGIPSRAEITDAAMSQRAECVMLNKGPHIIAALRTLDHILHCMDPHQSKKSSMLRALKVAQDFDNARITMRMSKSEAGQPHRKEASAY